MDFIKLVTGGFELKKQYLIIAILGLMITALGGIYALNRGDGTQEQPTEIQVDVTIKQEEQPDHNSSKWREGEFKKSKPVSW